jgi:hypothetical protein
VSTVQLDLDGQPVPAAVRRVPPTPRGVEEPWLTGPGAAAVADELARAAAALDRIERVGR